jgi:hypothetical protein
MKKASPKKVAKLPNKGGKRNLADRLARLAFKANCRPPDGGDLAIARE